MNLISNWAENPNIMKKSIFFRIFGLGAIPRKLRPVLDAEQIVVSDEGMGGWFIARKVRGPRKRYVGRMEGFCGCLAVTKKRIVCFTFWKRQINISVDDPRITEIHVNLPMKDTFSISFESSAFRDTWSGIIEYRFKTEKARQFYDVFHALGAREGTPVSG